MAENIVVAGAIRHGLYVLRGTDGGLNDDGRKDVENVARQMIQFFPQELLRDTLLLCGEKRRVRDTAEIVQSALGIVAVVMPILNVEGSRHAPRESVLATIEPLLHGKRAVLIAGQDHMVDWLPGVLHEGGSGYTVLSYAEAMVITEDGVLHKLEP